MTKIITQYPTSLQNQRAKVMAELGLAAAEYVAQSQIPKPQRGPDTFEKSDADAGARVTYTPKPERGPRR